MKEKENLSKPNEVKYTKLTLQPYLTSTQFSNKERNLLYALRSRCHASKLNFWQIYKNELQCTFGCAENEDQRHIFLNCQPIRQRIVDSETVTYESIFGNKESQKKAILEFKKIEHVRKTENDRQASTWRTWRQDPIKPGFGLM